MATRPVRPSRSQRAGLLTGRSPRGPDRSTGRFDSGAVGRGTGRPAHLPGLDGLRGIAVLAVVAYHLGHLRGGFVGVDVFFVLSGFLITRLLSAEWVRGGRISLRGFWARRIRRLFPLMAFVAVLVMAVARHVVASWRLTDLRLDALSALGFVANWRFIGSGESYFEWADAPSPLRHTWSLAVEEQFYIVWPLLFLVAVTIGRRRPRVAVAVMASVVAALSAGWSVFRAGAAGGADLSRIYYGTDTRIFAMAIGGVVASFFDPLRGRAAGRSDGVGMRRGFVIGGLVGGAGIVGGFALADDQAGWMYRFGFVGIALVTAAVIVGLVPRGGGLGSALSWPPLRWIGVRSYGIYLFSWPIQVFAEHRFPDGSVLVRDLGVVAVTLVFGWASFRLLERPLIEGRPPWDRSRRPVRRRGRVPAVVAASVAAAVLVGLLAADADPRPDFMAVEEAAAIEAAMTPAGFETGGVRGERPVGAATSTTASGRMLSDRAETRSIGAAPAAVLDPGPEPPFDPSAPVVVDGAARDPTSVFGRPLRILVFGDSVPASATHRDWEPTHLGIDLQRRAMYACSLAPGDWLFHAPGWEPRPYPDHCSRQVEVQVMGLDAGPDVAVYWSGAWDSYSHVGPDGTRYESGTDEYGELVRGWMQERVDLNRGAAVATLIAAMPCSGPDRPEPRTEGERRWFNDQLFEVAARNPGWVRVIVPETVLCDDEGRTVERAGGVEIRPDGLHFTIESGDWFWRTWLAGTIAAAFP